MIFSFGLFSHFSIFWLEFEYINIKYMTNISMPAIINYNLNILIILTPWFLMFYADYKYILSLSFEVTQRINYIIIMVNYKYTVEHYNANWVLTGHYFVHFTQLLSSFPCIYLQVSENVKCSAVIHTECSNIGYHHYQNTGHTVNTADRQYSEQYSISPLIGRHCILTDSNIRQNKWSFQRFGYWLF